VAHARRSFVGAAAAGVAVALLAVSGSVGALASSGHEPIGLRRAIVGGAIPEVASAQAVAATPAAKTLESVVFLEPRDPAGLKDAATAASAGTPLSHAEITSRFVPTSAQVAQVEAYLRSQGLRIAHRSLLSISVVGSAAAQERAFGFQLHLYRSSAGKLFRAPSQAPRLPVSIAGLVEAVGGLDTSMTLTHAATTGGTSQPAATVTPTCAGAMNAHSAVSGSLLPAQLGGTGGYNHSALINQGDDGSGEPIAFVEFSNYSTADVAHYRSCFPAITSPAAVNKPVAGGTANRTGAGEVELDLETAMSNAPDAPTYVYMAPNNAARTVDIIDRIVADQPSTGVRIVSDSWGLCEPAIPASLAAAENSSLQLAAAAGISFYVATGDDGSSGCVRTTGSSVIAAVDPATQPFATAVGGTRLHVSPRDEVTWRGGGGGVSMLFPKPSWQIGKTIGISGGGKRCGNPGGQCR
jgi:subtilase family serine protease